MEQNDTGHGPRQDGRARAGRDIPHATRQPRLRDHRPRVITDGSAYRSGLWRHTLTAAGIRVTRTRPFDRRPTARSNASPHADRGMGLRPPLPVRDRLPSRPPNGSTPNHHRAHTALGANHPPLASPTLWAVQLAERPAKPWPDSALPSSRSAVQLVCALRSDVGSLGLTGVRWKKVRSVGWSAVGRPGGR
jgi:hypothetical protein